MNVDLAKLRAYRSSVADRLASTVGALGEGVETTGRRFAEMVPRLRKLPTLADDLKWGAGLSAEQGEFGDRVVTRASAEEFLDTLDVCIAVLEAVDDPGPTATLTDHGVFFAGQPFDAFQRIASLIDKATRRVVVVDGHVGGRTLELIAAKGPAARASILTGPASNKPTFTGALATWRAQQEHVHGPIEVKVDAGKAFHDRFLIVDDSLFHFGASFKDAGGSGFMFSRIADAGIVADVERRVVAAMAKGTPL